MQLLRSLMMMSWEDGLELTILSLMVGGSVAGLAGSYSEVMKGIGASTRILDIIDRKPRIVSSMTSPYAATITLPPLHMHNIINAEYEDQSKMNSEGKKSDDKVCEDDGHIGNDEDSDGGADLWFPPWCFVL